MDAAIDSAHDRIMASVILKPELADFMKKCEKAWKFSGGGSAKAYKRISAITASAPLPLVGVHEEKDFDCLRISVALVAQQIDSATDEDWAVASRRGKSRTTHCMSEMTAMVPHGVLLRQARSGQICNS